MSAGLVYPGRIDLGIGRAPGSDSLTAAALAYPGARDVRHFPQQVVDVLAYLNDTLERSHPFSGVHAGRGSRLVRRMSGSRVVRGISPYGRQDGAAL